MFLLNLGNEFCVFFAFLWIVTVDTQILEDNSIWISICALCKELKKQQRCEISTTYHLNDVKRHPHSRIQGMYREDMHR